MTESMDLEAFHRMRNGGSSSPAHTWGEMNATEEAYSRELMARQIGGEVKAWLFEGIKFNLAGKTTYTPDFVVWLADGSIEIHEVKGFFWDDARVKYKVARDKFPMFRFRVVRKVRGGFKVGND